MNAQPDRRLLEVLEHVALLALLLAALVPRARDVARPLDNAGSDRAAAVLFERAPEAPGTRWLADRLADLLPAAVDATTRTNLVAGFQVVALAAHLLAAWALARLLRLTHGPAAALLAVTFWGTLPIAVLHGSLFGPENFGLACGLVAAVLLHGWLRDGRSLAAGLALAVALVGLSFGWTSTLLLAAVPAASWRTPRAQVSLAVALLLLGAAGVVHGLGERPGHIQLGRGPVDAFGLTGLVALLGLGLRLTRQLSPTRRERLDRFAVGAPPSVDLVVPLSLLGAAAYLLEPDASLLLFVPALAAGAAAVFVQVSRPLLGLRAGLGPVVVAVALVAIPGLAGYEVLRRQVADLPSPRPVEGLRP